MDCFAEPVIGRRFAPTRWLAMTKTIVTVVIPGRDEVASPESITTIGSMDSGPAPSGASSDVQLHIGE